jgi:Alpha galactosidase C-terminal beta sandwich domain
VEDRESPVIGYGTTPAEARTIVSFVALSGVAYSLASIMPELPEERIELLHKTLPTVPIFPIDLFSRGTDMIWDRFKHVTPDDYIHNYPEVLDLKVQAPAGRYDVVAMTNWRSWGDTRQLSFFDKLGLDPDRSYLAFDFWNQKIYGVFQKGMTVEVPPHDTRIFALHPVENHPQLVGISRHISGAYSVLQLRWNSERNSLSGSSQGINGESYTLWIYIPNGMTVSQVTASRGQGRTVPVKHLQEGNSLAVTFIGEAEPIEWKAVFTRAVH